MQLFELSTNQPTSETETKGTTHLCAYYTQMYFLMNVRALWLQRILLYVDNNLLPTKTFETCTKNHKRTPFGSIWHFSKQNINQLYENISENTFFHR